MARTKRITKKQAEQAVRYWLEQLLIFDYAVRVEVKNLDAESEGYAHAEASPEYRECIIRFDGRHVTPENLHAVAAHEVAHLLVWDLAHVAGTLAKTEAHREWVRKEEELLTTRLERIFLALTSATSSPSSPPA